MVKEEVMWKRRLRSMEGGYEETFGRNGRRSPKGGGASKKKGPKRV